MTNNRIFWAIEQVAIKSNSTPPTGAVAPVNSRQYISGGMASGVNQVNGLWEVPRGTQSAGMTTTFNLQQVFQLGQVEIYELSERQPDIEVTMSKCIDGAKPIFFMVTDPTQGNDIVARTASYRIDMALQLYPDTQFRATGKPVSIVTASGMYVSSISYTFPVDGFCTEDIKIVGNDKIWGNMSAISGITAGNGGTRPLVQFPGDADGGNPFAPMGLPSGVFGHDGNTSALVDGGAFEQAGGSTRFGVIVVGSGVQRREQVDIRRSVLPRDIPGITQFAASGINAAFVNGGFGAQGPGSASNFTQLIGDANTDHVQEHIQTITVSANIGRDDIFELGSKRPFVKVVAFPVEVTASIEVITAQGDLVKATSDIDVGPGHDNTSASNTVIIRTSDGLQVDLGDAMRLSTINVGGGEAGGKNMTVTYNYIGYNVFNVSHDFYQPNHRVLVFATGNSRFNVGAPSFQRSDFGLF
jgi:hypothetical protein